MVTLHNDFHNSKINLRLDPCSQALSKATAQRVRRTLCGVRGCTCGDVLGTRGLQRSQDGRTILVMAQPDGGAFLEFLRAE